MTKYLFTATVNDEEITVEYRRGRYLLAAHAIYKKSGLSQPCDVLVTSGYDGTQKLITADEIRRHIEHCETVARYAPSPEIQRMYENEDIYAEEVAEMDAKSKALNN